MQKGDWVIPVLFSAVAGAYLIESLDYPTKSALFPWFIIGLIFFLVLIFLVKELRPWGQKKSVIRPSSEEASHTLSQRLKSREFQNAFVLCAGIFLYWALAKPLGFILTNLLIVGGLARLLGATWRRTAIIALGLTVVLHVFFREYLHVPFPRGPGEMLYAWLKKLFLA